MDVFNCVLNLSIIGIIMFQSINRAIRFVVVVFLLDPPHLLPHSFSTGESIGQRRKKYTFVLYALFTLASSHSYPLRHTFRGCEAITFSQFLLFLVCFRLIELAYVHPSSLWLFLSFCSFSPFKSVQYTYKREL